jgi:hypothetical protein
MNRSSGPFPPVSAGRRNGSAPSNGSSSRYDSKALTAINAKIKLREAELRILRQTWEDCRAVMGNVAGHAAGH